MGVVCSSLRGTRSGGHRYPKLGWPLVPRPLGVEILVLCTSDPISARPAGAARVRRGPDGRVAACGAVGVSPGWSRLRPGRGSLARDPGGGRGKVKASPPHCMAPAPWPVPQHLPPGPAVPVPTVPVPMEAAPW